MQAYKAREDILLSLHTGISKVIQEEEDRSSNLYNSLNSCFMSTSFLGYKRNMTLQKLFSGSRSKLQTPRLSTPNEPKIATSNDDITVIPKEPEMDDLFERQKLASLQTLIEHQKKIEKELPIYYERRLTKNKKRKPASVNLDENSFERQFKLRQERRQEEINKRKLDLIKAHEVDIRGIEFMSICDNKESTVTDVIDAF